MKGRDVKGWRGTRAIAARGALALGVGLAAAGCGKPVLRVADASLGDYYTEKEYRKLNDEQREEYCRELKEQLSTYEYEITDAREALAALEARSRAHHAATDSMLALAASVEQRTEAMRSKGPGRPAPHEGPDTKYTVRNGDTLSKISARPEIYGDAGAWRRLYEANRDRIRDPARLKPGQEIRIPR
jgi:nucleoid-associated protein YgaU